jgi:hypothetical protein
LAKTQLDMVFSPKCEAMSKNLKILKKNPEVIFFSKFTFCFLQQAI